MAFEGRTLIEACGVDISVVCLRKLGPRISLFNSSFVDSSFWVLWFDCKYSYLSLLSQSLLVSKVGLIWELNPVLLVCGK